MATIRIKNLKLNTVIGTKEEERTKKQPIILNIEIAYDSKSAILQDDLSQAVDYEVLTQQIKELVQSSRFLLLETLCSSLLDLILQDPHVQNATLEIDKPNALDNTDSVSVVLSRGRD